jgi:hypothetical protein
MKAGEYMKVAEFEKFCDFLAERLGGKVKHRTEQLEEARMREPAIESSDYTPMNLYADIITSEGTGLYVQANTYPKRDRVEFSGYYPRDEDGNNQVHSSDNRPSITVALSKCTDQEKREAVYKDIQRRLWPDYLRVLAIVRERCDQVSKSNARRKAMLETIKKHKSVKVHGQDGDLFYCDEGRGRILSGSVELKLEVSAELAVTILETIKANKKKGGK